MGKKKGNTMIITLIIIFIFSSFFGMLLLLNMSINKQVTNFSDNTISNRELEQSAYNFFISNNKENELFYLDNEIIYYKEDYKIMFEVYIENNIINIRRYVKDE